MARIENDKIVKPTVKEGSGSFVDIRKAANSQSPVSTLNEDASRYAKGGK